MKNLLAILILICGLPASAACAINETGAACSVADEFGLMNNLNQSSSSLTMPGVRNLSQKSFEPAQNNNIPKTYNEGEPLRTFRQVQDDYGYNSGCQFGNCGQSGTPQNFPNPGNP